MVKIYTDSQFWINVLTQWAPTWAKNNWIKKKGEIKNLDLVQTAFELYQQSRATLIWVKGHSDNQLNAQADYWANQARQGVTLTEVKEKICAN